MAKVKDKAKNRDVNERKRRQPTKALPRRKATVGPYELPKR